MSDRSMFVVTNKSARMHSIAKQDILPGQTSAPIDEKYIDGVKKSPAFRAGELQEGTHKMPPPAFISLEKMDPSQAKKLIDTETDLKIIQRWIDAERRPEVLVSLKARIAAL